MGTVTVTNLGKAYKQYPTRWARLAEWVLPFGAPRHQLHWVLRDLNFRVESGEAVGIIGMNGAGKSTLLKMITGTTQPTTGKIEIGGRMAALLELGMGFHPDFTGRQNVFMAGQLLGYSADDIAKLMPEIESFAEIGDYIDQPVRVYSSGMQMRLAFSVATAARPDILIVDEALSVGDAYFQHKSFQRIRDYGKLGTTLLIVSHDKTAVQSICDRAILLDRGHLVMQGYPEAVMDYYNAALADRCNSTVRQQFIENGKAQTISGTGEASVVGVALLDSRQEAVDTIDVGSDVTLNIRVRVYAPIPRLVLGYMIKDRFGQPVFGTNTHHLEKAEYDLRSGEELIFKLSFRAQLGPGTYSVATALTSSDTHLVNNYEWRDLAFVFTVVNMTKYVFVGLSWLPPSLEVKR